MRLTYRALGLDATLLSTSSAVTQPFGETARPQMATPFCLGAPATFPRPC